MNKDYIEFLESKRTVFENSGIDSGYELNNGLFDFQSDIVKWALRKGRAAIFAGTGLGKSFMQLEWARIVSSHTNKPVIVLCPLAVAVQLQKEAVKFGINTTRIRSNDDIQDGINITNYQNIHNIDCSKFAGVVLDESSILKNFDGKTRDKLINEFEATPYRLAATATPAPNDFMELGNHAEFLGIMKYHEMLAMYFVHDGGETQKWRLKGHAKKDFWDWMASWSVMLQSPADLGYDGSRYDLPPLNEQQIIVDCEDYKSDEFLFPMQASTLSERIGVRRGTFKERCDKAIEIVKQSDAPCIIWCNLNSESDYIEKNLDGSVQVSGSDKDDVKESKLNGFSNGEFNYLVSKSSIAGFGMNWQHCNRMVFVGLNDSWEQVYQSIRRCYRFGQQKHVDVYYISSELEGNVIENLKRKDKQAKEMYTGIIGSMAKSIIQNLKGHEMKDHTYNELTQSGNNFTMHNGDCVEVTRKLDDESIDYSIFSPPFESLYTYSDSDRDMGNSKDSAEFWDHYRFLIKEQFRIHRSGRLISIHCMNLPTSKSRDGFIGIRDFRGEIIRSYEDAGFIYHSEVVIWKDPVTAMQRTKALGLLHKQIKKDSCMSRQGIPDYLVTFRKPGENIKPVSNTSETFPVSLWQQYASPVWMDINPSDTLQYRSAREHDDERHICPLQLDVIRRAMKLWSKEGDVVLSPFGGIGSEGWIALEMGRKYIGIELKKSYFDQAVKNLHTKESESKDLLSLAG